MTTGMTVGELRPGLRGAAIPTGISAFVLGLLLASGSRLVAGLVAVFVLINLVNLYTLARQRIRLGDGEITVRNGRGPITYWADGAVWWARASKRLDLPALVGLVDESGARRVITLGSYDRDEAWEIHQALLRSFPQVPPRPRRALPEHQAGWRSPLRQDDGDVPRRTPVDPA